MHCGTLSLKPFSMSNTQPSNVLQPPENSDTLFAKVQPQKFGKSDR